MKFKVKLLKDWTDPSGSEFKAGTVIEIEDGVLFAELVKDGIGEQSTAKDGEDESRLAKLVGEAVEKAVKDIAPVNTDKMIHVEVRDKSDFDPTGGYCGERVDDKYTKDELTYGLSHLCVDIIKATKSGHRPARLEKMLDQAQNQITKGIKDGIIDKASGDVQQVGVDSDGGFNLPVAFSNMLNEASLEAAVVRPRARLVQMETKRIELPQPRNYDHTSDTVFGGVTVEFTGENQTITESKVQWEQVALTLNKLTAMAKVTDEMSKWAPSVIGSTVIPALTGAIAWKEDDKFITGTGVGMPLGLNNAPGIVSVATESGQTLAASALDSRNIDKMYGVLKVESLASTVWLYNKPDLFNWLADLRRTVGTGGSAAGLVEKLPNSPQMLLYGLPLVETEHMQAAGTPGDIILTDLSQYLVADDRVGPQVARSIHLNFDTAKEAIRVIKYVDGQPRWREVFQPQNATADISSIVRLATRV